MFKKNLSWDIPILFLLLLGCDSFSQVLFKYASVDLGPVSLVSINQYLQFIFNLIRQPQLLFGLLLLVVAFICWMALITKIELSKAHLISCICYGIVPILSVVIFKEKINLSQLIGILVIVIGAIIASDT